MGKTSESLAELGGNQSGYAQEISNRKFETPSNGVIGRPGGKINISPLSKESSIVLRLFYQFRYIFNNLFVCLIDIRKVLLNINISNI